MSKIIKRVENPCKPDCPKRNMHCHGSCPDYAEFVAFNEAISKARQEHLDEISFRRKVHSANLGGFRRR